MKKYKKRIIEVEAVFYNGDNFNECKEFCPSTERGGFDFITINGNVVVSRNSWIIKEGGVFYTMWDIPFNNKFEELE